MAEQRYQAVLAVISDGLSISQVADQAGHTLWTATLGTHQHCAALGDDLVAQMTDVLTIILPAICTADGAPHYCEFVRQAAAGSPATSLR